MKKTLEIKDFPSGRNRTRTNSQTKCVSHIANLVSFDATLPANMIYVSIFVKAISGQNVYQNVYLKSLQNP